MSTINIGVMAETPTLSTLNRLNEARRQRLDQFMRGFPETSQLGQRVFAEAEESAYSGALIVHVLKRNNVSPDLLKLAIRALNTQQQQDLELIFTRPGSILTWQRIVAISRAFQALTGENFTQEWAGVADAVQVAGGAIK